MFVDNMVDYLAQIAQILPAFVVALSCHEFSHALVSTLLGDNTAKEQGRLTLNPFAHISFLGTLFLLLFRIGWAKPVPFNMENFKHPRAYSILTALAGPFANFVVALLCFTSLNLINSLHLSLPLTKTANQIFGATAEINVMLGVFNLMPIPPLDGSHFIFAALYKNFPHLIIWLYRYSMFILIIFLMMPGVMSLLLTAIYYTLGFIKSLAPVF